MTRTGRLLRTMAHTPLTATRRQGSDASARALYLDLLKRTLTGRVYEDVGNVLDGTPSFDEAVREQGRDWPSVAHSMIGAKRMDNLQWCVEDALMRGVPGDLIETGVWRGGASIFMRAILKAHGETGRRVWVADSFQGLPAPNPERYPQDAESDFHIYEQLRVGLEQVRRNFERYGLLDSQVEFLRGWFSETLPNAPIGTLAVMRLDGDMYESTMDALSALYPKLSQGGYVIVDDYGIEMCKQAVHDYREHHHIDDEIVEVDWTGVYWRKS